MSSEGADVVTGEQYQQAGLVPKLRFPEFNSEWLSSAMSAVYSFKGNNSLSRDKLNYASGTIKNIHYGDIHTKFSARFRVDSEKVPFVNEGEKHSSIRTENFCATGDMVFADASEDMNGIGKSIEIIDVGNTPVVAGLHTILSRPKPKNIAPGFGVCLFSSERVRRQIQRESQGAKVLGLSANRLGSIELRFPSDLEEQKKIADCLSSTDALIATEAGRLDAMKVHKKGLMQQLFPTPGETTPRLRFPEFQDAGEWEEKEVGDIFTVTRGNVLAMTLVEDVPTDRKPYPVYSSQTKRAGLAGYYSDFLYENAITWTTDGANAGDVNYRAGKFYCTNVCGVLLSRDGYANACVAAIINSVSKSHVSYVGNPKLMNGVMAKIMVPLPSVEEQAKIALCLSSADALIMAQGDKIDILKVHKRGLMQQLFPVADEVQA